MITKTTREFRLKKDESKDIPLHCDKCDDIYDHTVTFKNFEKVSQLVTYTKRCIRCKQKAMFKYDPEPEIKTDVMDVETFHQMWMYMD